MLFRSNDTATTEIYTLSLHDALPISVIDNLNARINAWWVMVVVIGVAFWLGTGAVILLFCPVELPVPFPTRPPTRIINQRTSPKSHILPTRHNRILYSCRSTVIKPHRFSAHDTTDSTCNQQTRQELAVQDVG